MANTARKLYATEHQEQVSLICWAKARGTTKPELLLLFAIPNGGKRHITTALKLKAEGVKPAIPDLMLPIARRGFHGLFIEMKSKIGYANPEQKSMHEQLRAQGYAVEVCRGWEKAKIAIEEYLGT